MRATHIYMHNRKLIIKCVRELLLLMPCAAVSPAILRHPCWSFSFAPSVWHTCECACRQISLLRFYLSVGASFNFVYRFNLSAPCEADSPVRNWSAFFCLLVAASKARICATGKLN